MNEHVDIAVVGDSHTYGVNVPSAESWPYQLGLLAGMTAYNFGVGGYGPLHYHHLIERAVLMEPRFILVGLYLANDLQDACYSIETMTYWEEWADSRGFEARNCFSRQTFATSPSMGEVAKVWFKRTAIGSSLSYVLKPLVDQGKRRIWRVAPTGIRDGDVMVDEVGLKTTIGIERIRKHAASMTMESPWGRLGLSILKDVLLEDKRLTRAHGIGFAVVCIPSKEYACYELLGSTATLSRVSIFSYVENETRLVDGVIAFCEANDITVSNALGHVRAALQDSNAVYPGHDEGHPLAPGYAAYARAGYEAILKESEK